MDHKPGELFDIWMPFNVLIVLCLFLGTAMGGADPVTPTLPEVQFETSRTTLWVGRGAVLTFRCATKPTSDLELPVVIADPALVKAQGAATILAGEELGSLRLRALEAGRTTLKIGDGQLEIHVRRLPAQLRSMNPPPHIVVPVLGSVVWGKFVLACEIPRNPGRANPELWLELPGGRCLPSEGVLHQEAGATHRVSFEIDADELAEGRQGLRVLVIEDGVELSSATRIVTVVHGAEGGSVATYQSGECEAALELPRPVAYGEAIPRVGSGTGASGGAYMVFSTPYPHWVTPITIEEAGHYQMMVTARGDFAGGAFPSMGVSVDAPFPMHGATRLVRHSWHRLPVGSPVKLDAGKQALGLKYINELSVGVRSDRNLYLDRWELLRVDSPEVGQVEASAMMMQGDPPQEQAGIGFGLWIAFDRPVDGLTMNGQLRLNGAANWSGAEDSVAPIIDLLVDGEVHATQQAAKPDFLLEPSQLGKGEHKLQMVARLSDGRRAETPVQHITVPDTAGNRTPLGRYRYSVLDKSWGGSLDGALVQDGEEPRQRVAQPKKELLASLELPTDLKGRYEVLVEAQGLAGDRKARVEVRLQQRSGTGKPLGIRVQDSWRDRSLGVMKFVPGAKRLLLRITPSGEKAFLRVRSITLVEAERGLDRKPPVARILYPAQGHQAHGVDAVVVEAFDDRAVESADILIDGRPQGTHGFYPRGAGHLVLPLIMRNLEPGPHQLAVRVLDASGNLGESESITFSVDAQAPEQLGTYARAVHLLNRLAFGPDPRELAEILVRGEKDWLRNALNETGQGDRTAREFAHCRNGDDLAYDAERLVISSALRTDNPLRERFVLWVDNHFSTWAGKTGQPAEWTEYAKIADSGLQPFGELLRASATSPNMLRYLNQNTSYAGRLNENYARELLELHTVGARGGYTQADVTGLARLLCGLTLSLEAPSNGLGSYKRSLFRFVPELSDGKACTLFARRFEAQKPSERYDRFLEVIEFLAHHPRTAEFMARKLAQHYVSSTPPEELVADLKRVFLESGGDFREMLTAMIEHSSFWATAGDLRLANPLDYGLRIARVLGDLQVDRSLCEFLRSSGMGLFDCPTPDGYPDEDGAWGDSRDLIQRWRWVQKINSAVLNLVPEHSRHYDGGDPDEWRQRVVDLAAVRLTGRLLGEESNAAALGHLAEDGGNYSESSDRMARLLCRLPESNLK